LWCRRRRVGGDLVLLGGKGGKVCRIVSGLKIQWRSVCDPSFSLHSSLARSRLLRLRIERIQLELILSYYPSLLLRLVSQIYFRSPIQSTQPAPHPVPRPLQGIHHRSSPETTAAHPTTPTTFNINLVASTPYLGGLVKDTLIRFRRRVAVSLLSLP